MFKSLSVLFLAILLAQTDSKSNFFNLYKSHARLATKLLKAESEYASEVLFNNTLQHSEILASVSNFDGITYRYGGCTCQMQACLCCAALQVNEVFENDKACYQLKYNQSNNILYTDVSINKTLNETVTHEFKPYLTSIDENCFELSANHTVCSKFYNMLLSFDRTAFEGCVEMAVKESESVLAKLKVGCFSMLNAVSFISYLFSNFN